MGPGCYGCNGADTVSYDAALLSQAVGKPVRVQLTRKDEMAWENYGFAFVIDERVALDADGTIAAWDHESWSPTLGGRPGANNPGNVVTGSSRRLRTRRVHAAVARTRSDGVREQQQRGAVVRHRLRLGPLRRHRHDRQPARPDAQRASRRSSPDRCGRRSGCRTRSRTNRSWTKSRRR